MTDKITSEVTVELKPWGSPNFALRISEEQGKDAGSVPVPCLSQNALDQLAKAWLESLYTKAGKKNNWVCKT